MKIGNIISSAASKLPGFIQQRGASAYKEITNTEQNPLLSGIKATGQAFGAITDVASKGLNKIPGVGAITQNIGSALNKGVDALASTQTAQNYAQNNPQPTSFEKGLEGLQGLGQISSGILTAQGAATVGNKVAGLVSPKKELTIEQMIEKQYGFQPGMRKQFDDALMHKDASALNKLLPQVPKEYSSRFTDQINQITGGSQKVAGVDEFLKNPSGFQLYRGEGSSNVNGLHYTTDPSWANNFGPTVKQFKLPTTAKLKTLTNADMEAAFTEGIMRESDLWNKFFKQGYDAVVGTDSMSPSKVDVILNPRLLTQ